MSIILILTYIFGSIVGIFFLISIFAFLQRNKNKDVYGGMEMEVYSVKMPRFDKEENDFKQAVGAMEQVYANFLYIKESSFLAKAAGKYPRISLEVASGVGEKNIIFYIAVPKKYGNPIVKSIQGVYPGAVIERAKDDYTIFEPNSAAAASYLQLENDYFFPLTSYTGMQADPLSAITNSLSKLSDKEGAAVQLVIKPVEFDFRHSGAEKIRKIAEETSKNKNSSEPSGQFILNALRRDYGENKEAEEKKYIEPDRVLIESVQTKIKKPALNVNIRLVSSAPTRDRADLILQDLKSGFSQFMSAYNGFKFVDIPEKKVSNFIFDYAFRIFRYRESVILNSEELSSIYHFPAQHIKSPNIKWAKVSETEPPHELPAFGDICLGKTVYRGEEKNVWFANESDRRRHCYVVGQTGTGKSSLLFEMARQDILNGKGVGIIDPHGDLVEDILSIIPKERAEDVVLFEPADMTRPVGLNMLEWENSEQKDFVVSEMISIFSKLFPPEIIGPMFEHYMRNAMLALMADKNNPGTLVEIPRIFTDDAFMEEKLSSVSDPLVRSFWLREWKQTVGQTKSDMLGYVVSKVGRFVENEMMRNIIGQSKSGFDLPEIMNSGKIFLANLSKGRTGEMNSSLLGLILISKMQVAVMQRANVTEDQRKDFYLYIDEFHNFTTDNIATILSEARKYRLNLILAHQYIPQLEERIKNAVMGNAGTIMSFRVGAQDAEFLEKQFEPGFSRRDLVNLDNFYFVLKMMINNNVTSPFKAMTIRPQKGNLNIVEPIKKIAKLKYGRAREIIEAEIAERWNF